MHIIFFDFDDIKNPLLGGGQAHATWEVGTRLAKMGNRVVVISSRFPGSKDRLDNGITYKHIGLGSRNIRLNNIIYPIIAPFFAIHLSADIIVECFTAPASTLLTPLFTKIPVVGLPTSFDAKRFSKLYHIPFWIMEKYGSKLYSYFIAFTPYLAEKMHQYNSQILTKVIGQGVGEEYFHMTIQKPTHILFLGRLDMNQKGIDLLIEAYKKAEKEIAFPLLIAGDGPDKVTIEKLIKKNGLEKSIHLVGQVKGDQKKELLEHAAFIAFPSRNEGFSLFSLEAIASGHRLVAFDIPSLSFANEDVARKIKPFSTDLFAKALIDESRSEEWDKKANVTKNFVKSYSWDSVAMKFVTFFEEILQKEKNEK